MRTMIGLLALSWVLVAGCSGGRRRTPDADAGSEPDGQVTLDGEAERDAQPTLPDAELPDAQLDAQEPDAQDPDAEVDAQVDAAVIDNFSITVLRGAVPLAGVRVWFHGADGALLSEQRTDAAGKVIAEAAPAMVTAAAPLTSDANGATLPFTFTALQPGDRPVLSLPAEVPPGAPVPAYQVSLSAAPPADSEVQLVAGSNGCAGLDFFADEPGPFTLDWPRYCPVAQGNSILAVAYEAGLDVGAFAFVKGVPAFGATPQPAQLGAFMPGAEVQLSVDNLPRDTFAIASLGMWSEGARFCPSTDWIAMLPGGSTTRSASFPTAPGFAESHDVLLTTSGPAADQHSTVVVRGAPSASIAIDFATRVGGALSGSRSFTPRAGFGWQVEGSATAADASVLTMSWSALVGGSVGRQSWFLLAPGDATALTVPQLPPGLYEPGANLSATVSRFATSLDDGYRAFLTHAIQPIAPFAPRDGHPLSVALPSDGYLHAVTWTEP